jgi:hypothetical protein
MLKQVPNSFTSGESVSWQVELSLYPTAQWNLIYHFRGNGVGFDLEAAKVGGKFILSLDTETSEKSSAGKYYFQAFVSNGTDKVKVDQGEIRIHPNLSHLTEDSTFDGSTDSEKLLEAIDAVLVGRATSDQQSYQIGTRQLTRIPIPDLILLREKTQQRVNQEARNKNILNGGSYLKTIKAKFVRPA